MLFNDVPYSRMYRCRNSKLVEVPLSDGKKQYHVAPKTLEFYGVGDEDGLRSVVMPWPELEQKLAEVEKLSNAELKSRLEAVSRP